MVGRKLAATYGFKRGRQVPLKGTIFPGNWEFTVRAIYEGRDASTDTSQFFFHWDYLNETMSRRCRAAPTRSACTWWRSPNRHGRPS